MLVFTQAMGSHSVLTRLRRLPLWSVAVFPILGLVLLGYQTGSLQDVLTAVKILPPSKPAQPHLPQTYNDTTQSIFPSIVDASDDESDLCSNFPQQWLDKVQVIMKTGAGDWEKNEAHLASVTSCIRNLIVVSDFEEQLGGHNFIDVLATLPAAYKKHPDFEAYYLQQDALVDGKVELSREGWKLDRFKFLPMVDTAYQMRPNASWYVFLEADVYIFWDNLFRLLDHMDPQEMHYLGSAVPGSKGRWFAYGGAGTVISQGLMHKLVGDGTRLSQKYQKMVLDDCCGDAVLGYVILKKTGVKLGDVYPMFSGDHPEDLKVDEQRWCTPLISLHRVSASVLRSLWRWERTRRASQKRTLVFSDLLAYRQPDLMNTSFHESWDNLSGDLLPNDTVASQSSSACADACENNVTCLQYSYRQNECRLWPYIAHGHEVIDKDIEFVSGWQRQKMRTLGLNFDKDMDPGCEIGRWTKPFIH